MSNPTNGSNELPEWVRARDGRLIPFDPDQISNAIFAATERASEPDSLLARELTGGVLHFLGEEAEGRTVEESLVREMIVKVVRELGHPQLARFLEEQGADAEEVVPPITLGQARREAMEQCALQAIYSPDLRKAHRDGLITLQGLSHPEQPASALLPARASGSVLEMIAGGSHWGGETVAIASAEEVAGERWLEDPDLALRLTGSKAVLNLNRPSGGTRGDGAWGPLFPEGESGEGTRAFHERTDALISAMPAASDRMTFDYHLRERDLGTTRLLRVARAALSGAEVRFVLDRPRGVIRWAEGISAQHPLVLQIVVLHVDVLARLLPVLEGEPRDVLNRLGETLRSLARMAISAANQKRRFLRQHAQARGPARRGFLLERGRLLVIPAGLESTVHEILPPRARAETDRLLRELREHLHGEGRRSALEVCMEAPREEQSIERIGELHAICDEGTGHITYPGEVSPAQIVEWLRLAWQQPSLARIRFSRRASDSQELAFGET